MPLDLEKLKELSARQAQEEAVKALDPAAEQIERIPIDDLTDCPPELNRFQPRSPEKLEELVESIRLNGIINPLRVRRLSDGTLQILCGHNRRRAARKLGYSQVPCIIRDIPDDDEARLWIIADNTQHNSDRRISELAWAYRDELEIRQKIIKRGRPTGDAEKAGTQFQLSSRDSLSGEKSGRQKQKYIRLTYLLPALLELVDQKKIGIGVGVELSFLKQATQRTILRFCYSDGSEHPLKESQARKLREIEADPDQVIDEELLEELTAKRKKVRFRTLKLEMTDLRGYFPVGTPEEVVVRTIHKALADYYANKEN